LYFVFLTLHDFYLIAGIILVYCILFHKSQAILWVVSKSVFGTVAALVFSYFLAEQNPAIFERLTWCNVFLSSLLTAVTLILLFEKHLRQNNLFNYVGEISK
jgi:ABC-type Fe3+-siderophore transport system permease subunit